MINQKTYDVGVYTRLSKDDLREGDSLSIENQKMILEKHVKEQGWNLVDTYVDDGYTGVNFERPDFKRMLEDAKNGKINLILVKDLSRFGRNYVLIGQFTDYIFPSIGCRFIALNDGVDTIHNENDIMPFKNLFNEFYCRDTSKKVKSVKKASAVHGKIVGARAPYGYKRDPKDKTRLVVDENVAHIVKRIFEMKRSGLGASKIAAALNNDGILSPIAYYYQQKGTVNPNEQKNRNVWVRPAVETLLANEVYLGHAVQGKSEKVSYKTKQVVRKDKSEWIKVEHTHEAIVDQELWDAVEELGKRKFKTRSDHNGNVHIFAGKLKCKDCGYSMKFCSAKRKNKPDYISFTCSSYAKTGRAVCTSHNISLDLISQALTNDIKYRAVLVVEDMDKVIHEIAIRKNKRNIEENKTLSIEIKTLSARLAELDKLTQSIYEDKVLGKIPENVCTTLIQKYEIERTEKAELYEKLRAKMDLIQKDQMDIVSWADSIKKYIAIEEIDRSIVMELIDKIEISECTKVDGNTYQDITIYYNFVGNID